uniref:Uncharacterized protein n=1 Tax=Anguilla anguilla TaxID=7936 RepID=A0A0E9V7J3_ANGAN
MLAPLHFFGPEESHYFRQ